MSVVKSSRVERICKICSCVFWIDACQIKRGRGSYCSKTCSTVAKTIPIEERFWKYVNKTDGCWLWTGGCDWDGYGLTTVNKKCERAPRVSWSLANGPIPDGLWVLHKCDNPPCVRPDHLFLGTSQDNSIDREEKGRGNKVRGEKCHMSKLSPQQVVEIRDRVSRGEMQSVVALDYPVGRPAINLIVKGKCWNHL